MTVRVLYPTDVAAYRALRLAAIAAAPADFATTHGAESAIALNRLQQRLVHTPFQRVLGAFDGARLVGMVSIKREPIALVHDRAHLWGVYVLPELRRQGLGRALLDAALAYVRSVPELKRVTLLVGLENHAARALYRTCGFISVAIDGAATPSAEEQMLLLL